MPKLKTNRAAAKRFRKTAKGFKRAQSQIADTSSPRRRASVSASCAAPTMVAKQDTRPARAASSARLSEVTHGTS